MAVVTNKTFIANLESVLGHVSYGILALHVILVVCVVEAGPGVNYIWMWAITITITLNCFYHHRTSELHTLEFEPISYPNGKIGDKLVMIVTLHTPLTFVHYFLALTKNST